MQPPDDLNLVRMLGLLAGSLALFLFGLELLTGALKVIAGLLDKLRLDDTADVQKFRLVSEIIEHGKEVTRFARMIAKAMQHF
jgi:hypothetical protein